MSVISLPKQYKKLWQSRRDRLYERLSERRVILALTVLPAVLLFLFINIVPIVWAIAASFHEIHIFDPDWDLVLLENYAALARDEAFHVSLLRSVTFTVGTVTFQLIVGVTMAVLVARRFRFNKFARALVMLPYLIPTAIVAYMAHFMMNSTYGIVNWMLMDVGVVEAPIAWFGTSSTAMISVIGVNWWKYTAFVSILVIARILSIPDSHYEAAKVSGAGWWQQFRDITLPNLKGVIFIVVLFRGIWMFLHFDSIWILTSGGPGDSTMVSAVYAYEQAFQMYSLGYSAAIASVLFLILAVSAVLYFIVLEPEKEVRVE